MGAQRDIEEARRLWLDADQKRMAADIARADFEEAGAKFNSALTRIHARRRVPADQQIDLWGDGQAKPPAECKPPPKAK